DADERSNRKCAGFAPHPFDIRRRWTMSIQPDLVFGRATFRRRLARQNQSLEQSERSEQYASELTLGRFAQGLLLSFQPLQIALRFPKFQDFFFEPSDMGIRAGQLGTARVQSALKFADFNAKTRHSRLERQRIFRRAIWSGLQHRILY
ncbi:MAG: hypothetical protein QOI96_1155, partial [Verrucomicrobiota bacterium]